MLTYRFCPLSNPNSPEIRQVCFSVKQPAPADCFHLADCKVNEFFSCKRIIARRYFHLDREVPHAIIYNVTAAAVLHDMPYKY